VHLLDATPGDRQRLPTCQGSRSTKTFRWIQAKGTRPTRELAVIAYQQAAGLHERLAALYEQLGHPDRARQEWQRAAGARARGEGERDSQNRPTAPQGS
jgi:hypothetical protein